MSMEDLSAQDYISPTHPTRSGLGTLSSTWTAGQLTLATVDCRKLRRLSFTLQWSAVASTDGDFRIEVTDDPRADRDLMAVNSTPTPTPIAQWVEVTYPSGSTDGTNVTVSGKNATIAATAGSMRIDLDAVHAFVRLKWVRRAGGGTDQLTAQVSGLAR